MRDRRILRLAVGGLMAALILLLTATLKLPVPATGGYIHMGDAMIFLAAFLLGPQAALCAAVGSALADVLGGYLIYAAPTFVIKGLMGLWAGKRLHGKGIPGQLFVFSVAEMIMLMGYFAFESLLMSPAAAIAALPMNFVQGLCGVSFGLVFCSLAQRLPRM